jgi:hypothetical protein
MADKAMDVYLNDHLAGAMLGSDLAKQIGARNEGTPLGGLMASLAPQIEEDRQTLIGLMERMDISRSTVKEASAWVTEKASRVKFAGLASREAELGGFMALETLALGVQGKLALWTALRQVATQYPELGSVDLGELSRRAQSQYDALEGARLSAGRQALARERVSA